jgi:hypothetical protein
VYASIGVDAARPDNSNVCIISSIAPKIERIIVLLSASPEGEARLPMPKGMAYKE